MPKVKNGRKGATVPPPPRRRSVRNVRAPPRLVEESDDSDVDVSAGAPAVADLRRQIAELQSQLQHATTPPATPVVSPAVQRGRLADASGVRRAYDGVAPPVAPPAAPTHLLAPAQPVAQDLLVDTLKEIGTINAISACKVSFSTLYNAVEYAPSCKGHKNVLS